MWEFKLIEPCQYLCNPWNSIQQSKDINFSLKKVTFILIKLQNLQKNQYIINICEGNWGNVSFLLFLGQWFFLFQSSFVLFTSSVSASLKDERPKVVRSSGFITQNYLFLHSISAKNIKSLLNMKLVIW